MGKINLNDEKFDDNGSNVKVINGGKSGVVVVELDRVEKKGESDNPNSPDYKIFFKDESGAEINEGFYHVDTSREYADKNIITLGKRLKHYCHAIIPSWEMPEFDDAKAMLDQIMIKLKDAGNATGIKVKLAVCYGTTQKTFKYLAVKRTLPFVVSLNSETEIEFSDIDVTERPQQDNPSNNASSESTTDTSGGGWG